MMNQQEFEKRVKEARGIQERAMAMFEESSALAEVDFKRSNELFLESIKLWQKGCEMFNEAAKEVLELENETQTKNTVKENKNMVIDYLKKDEAEIFEVFEITSRGEINYHSEKEVEGITFLNFPNIHLEGALFKNCRFENCQEVEAYQCKINDCVFHNVSEITGHYTDFYGCTFEHCCSQGPLLTIDSDGSIEHCVFNTISALTEDGYVIFSAYDKKSDIKDIVDCYFADCEVENDEGELAYCVYFKPFSSRKSVEIDNFDRDSCVFRNKKKENSDEVKENRPLFDNRIIVDRFCGLGGKGEK